MYSILTDETVTIPSAAATEGVQFHLVDFNRKEFAVRGCKLGVRWVMAGMPAGINKQNEQKNNAISNFSVLALCVSPCECIWLQRYVFFSL